MSSTIKSLFSAIKTLAIVGEATAEEISYGKSELTINDHRLVRGTCELTEHELCFLFFI